MSAHLREYLKARIGVQEILLCLLLVVILYEGLAVFSLQKQLPGPLYGGDLYLHFGIVNHIANGGSPLASSHFLGEYEHYPWLMHLLVVAFSKVFGLSLLKAMIYFPLLISLSAAIVAYLLGARLFGDKDAGLLLALWWVASRGVPGAVPTHFSDAVLLPLIPLAFWKAETLKSKITAGLVYGICGIGHVVAFLAANIFLGLRFLQGALEGHVRFGGSKLRIVNSSEVGKSAKKSLLSLLPIFLVGLPIALLYWAPPIFVYHASTLNPWQEYVATGVGGLTGAYVWGQLKGMFLNLNGLQILFSVLALLGLWRSLKGDKTPLLVFLTGLFGLIHPWITTPLFGTSFGYYGFPSILGLARTLFIVGGAVFAGERLARMQRHVLYAALALVIIFSNISIVPNYLNGQWTKVGMEMPPPTAALFELGDWVKANAAKDAVFISPHDESAFALNGLSGAKVVSMRRTHSSPYVDVNKRIADEAVMLYGKDDKKVAELLKEYNVKYLYEDVYSVETAATCTKVFDALVNPQYGDLAFNCLTTDPKYADYLNANGIAFVQTTMRLDPASEQAPKFDMLAIKPGELSPYLQAHLKKAKEAAVEGQTLAAIMQIAQ